MTDAEFQAWLDQHGGEAGRKDVEEDVDDPSGTLDPNTGKPRKIKRIDRTDVTAKDGATMSLRRVPGSIGVLAPGQPQYDLIATTPPTAAGTAAVAGSREPPKHEDVGGRRYVWRPNPPGQGGGQWVDVGPAPLTPAEQAQQPSSAEEPVEGYPGWIVRKTKVGNDTRTVFVNPQGQEAPDPRPAAVTDTSAEEPLPGYPGWMVRRTKVGGDTRTVFVNPDGQQATDPRPPANRVTTTKRPSKDRPGLTEVRAVDPVTGLDETYLEDAEGRRASIKPGELPSLQARYGELAQELGSLAQDLNSRYARGEITAEERTQAFTAAHQQAQTQVSEINSILENSRAVWGTQIQQRGQTLGETQSRRGFAADVLGRAVSTGQSIAQSAGPGHGTAIAAGVGALMNIGQRYAEGMGGFRESPEIPLPRALEQAQGIGLPGYGAAPPAGVAGGGAAPPSGLVPPGAGGPAPAQPSWPGTAFAPTAAPGAVPQSILDTTDIGPGGTRVPRVRTPAAATSAAQPVAPALVGPPGGAGLGSLAQPVAPPAQPVAGPSPLVAGMAQNLAGGAGFGGSPVAAGGLGMFDPTQEMASMLGQGGDPEWEQAVRAAAQAEMQPGYAWQRFGR